MSKFTAKPYIETVLGEVSGENKAKLLNFINGKAANGSDAVSYTLCKTVAEIAALTAGVHAVEYKFSSTITWKGYFIRTTNYKAFITFKNGIDLWLASVYKVGSDLIPMEKVTADNIRALLREDSYVDASELASASPSMSSPIILGTLTATSSGSGEENDPYVYSAKVEYNGAVEDYDLYIFTMNGSFVLTPLSQEGEARSCGSFAYNDGGDSMIARLRFEKGSGVFRVHFDAKFAEAVYGSGIAPTALLIGIKL